jgi:hypothetical protein
MRQVLAFAIEVLGLALLILCSLDLECYDRHCDQSPVEEWMVASLLVLRVLFLVVGSGAWLRPSPHS